MKELKENCIGSEENQIFFTVGFLFIGVYSMYFLPIWTITNMYKVSWLKSYIMLIYIFYY